MTTGQGAAIEAARGTPETLADRAEQLAGGLSELDCERCAMTVLVKKNSPQHTSIQWTRRAAAGCAEFARAKRGASPAPGCASLRESIDRAALDGRLGVGAPCPGTAARR